MSDFDMMRWDSIKGPNMEAVGIKVQQESNPRWWIGKMEGKPALLFSLPIAPFVMKERRAGIFRSPRGLPVHATRTHI
jgi:hypothetical protein